MRKIPTLFKRDPDNMARVLPQVHPDCQWVVDGEGWSTRKLDGMCCAIRNGQFVKRREVRKRKLFPGDFVWEETDKTTGKSVGWMPVGDGPEDKYFREALANVEGEYLNDRTFELVGPKSQGNVEHYDQHMLIMHDDPALIIEAPRSFDALSEWLSCRDVEGIVWHHSDGRMAKIKGKDFGHRRDHENPR